MAQEQTQQPQSQQDAQKAQEAAKLDPMAYAKTKAPKEKEKGQEL